VCIYCVSGEFVVLRDGYKVDVRWIHLAVTNKPATINEEAIDSDRVTTFLLLPQ